MSDKNSKVWLDITFVCGICSRTREVSFYRECVDIFNIAALIGEDKIDKCRSCKEVLPNKHITDMILEKIKIITCL